MFALISVVRFIKRNGNSEIIPSKRGHRKYFSLSEPLKIFEVFRWDSNINGPKGSHYHIYGMGHYYPGDAIPEPYATIYFG